MNALIFEDTLICILEQVDGDGLEQLYITNKQINKLLSDHSVLRRLFGKYELIEGWHRTMSALKLGDNGEDLKNWDKIKLRAFVLKK